MCNFLQINMTASWRLHVFWYDFKAQLMKLTSKEDLKEISVFSGVEVQNVPPWNE